MKNKISRISPERKMEIKELIEQIRQESYDQGYEDGKAFVSVETVEEKSPNQQRAEMIEKAKKFVEVKSKSVKNSSELKLEGGYFFKQKENPNFCDYALKVKFINKGNRVTCLLEGARGIKVFSTGRSNCNPNDVFNLYIGQAISLARALKIDVPVEFLEAVQPSEVVLGMEIRNEKDFPHAAERVLKGDLFKVVNIPRRHEHECQINSAVAKSSTITDDTYAQYGVTS